MPCCSAVQCSNRSENGFRLFKLPEGKRNEERIKLWIRNIGRTSLPPVTYICEVHFSDDQFENNRKDGKKLLKWNAVPTKFDHRKPQMTRKPPFKRHYAEIGSDCETVHPTELLQVTCMEVLSSDDASTEDDEEKRELRRKLKAAYKKIKKLETELQKYKNVHANLFSPDQMKKLSRDNMQGFKWSDESIHKALKLYLSCGTNGYEELRRQNLPYPSVRTLQHRMAVFDFNPGILNDIFDLLKLKMECLKEEEKQATLLIDEMFIKEGLEYDANASQVIGKPTMSLSGGKSSSDMLASHALVFMLAGVTTRWKQTVGYEFTGPSYDAHEMKEKVFTIIKKSYAVGITVKAVICDMGSQNRSLFRLCNITATRYGEIVNSCKHPCIRNELLYFVCDVPHVLKNIRNALLQGHTFHIEDPIVKKYQLPCKEVTLEAVKHIVQLDAGLDLKLAPRLKESILNPSHFDKMNVGLALALLNHDVAAAIRYCILTKNMDQKMLTTAWFFEIIFKWFSVMTARSQKLALSQSNSEIYEETLSFLKDFLEITRNIRVGEKPVWRPFQTGMLLSTQTAIDFQNAYLNNGTFRYVLLGRLTQDALENLFSIVRSRSPIPGPRDFKTALRLITLSQYEFKPRHGSYAVDDCEYLTQYISSRTVNDENAAASCEEIDDILDEDVTFGCASELNSNSDSNQSLYYVIGCILYKLKKNFATCDACFSDLQTTSNDMLVANMNTLTKLKQYRNDCLAFPSLKSYNLFYEAEVYFRRCEEAILQNKINLSDITLRFMDKASLDVPKCHNVLHKGLKLFFKTRMYFALRKYNTLKATHSEAAKSSRSAYLSLKKAKTS